MNPAQKLVEKFGSNAAVGREFNITREAVRLWVEKGIPPDRALEVQQKTGGGVTAMEVLKFHQTVRNARTAAASAPSA